MASFLDTIVDSTVRQHCGVAANIFSDCLNYYYSLEAEPQISNVAATEASASSDIKSSVSSVQVDTSGSGPSQTGSSIAATPCKVSKYRCAFQGIYAFSFVLYISRSV